MELAGQGTLCADANSCRIGEKEGDASELENTGNRAGERGKALATPTTMGEMGEAKSVFQPEKAVMPVHLSTFQL